MHLENITPFEQLFARVTVNNHTYFAETATDGGKSLYLMLKTKDILGNSSYKFLFKIYRS